MTIKQIARFCSGAAIALVVITALGPENWQPRTGLGWEFDHVVGYLADGMKSLEGHPELTTSTDRLGPALAAERLASPDPPLAVDVRAPAERALSRIPGSVNIPLNHLTERLNELPRDRTLLLYCAGGYRSSVASSLLEQQGFTRLEELAGGITAWETAGLNLEP